MAKDEKQKEKHATNQFFRSLLGHGDAIVQRIPNFSETGSRPFDFLGNK
jgi:hypothetical protein